MKIRKTAVAIALALSFAAADAAPAPTARTATTVEAQLQRAYGDAESFKAFLEKLQSAVAKEQTKTVARMVAYPFETMINGKQVTLKNRWQFLKVYDEVMRGGIIIAIRDQAFSDLIVTKMGVAIGNGDVWLDRVGEGDDQAVKIIAINQNVGV